MLKIHNAQLCKKSIGSSIGYLTKGRAGFSQDVTSKCWKCGFESSSLFCPKCKVVQAPVQSSDYFKVFKLVRNFDVNLKELTGTYRNMQSFLHPDKFSNSSTKEKSISEEYSSLVNKAYGILQTPLTRAIHLLRLNGDDITEEDKASDPEFLMTIMELNEEVDEADSNEKLKSLDFKNKGVLDELSKSISEAFKASDLKKAKDEIIKMKYYNSLGVRINNLLREKGVVD